MLDDSDTPRKRGRKKGMTDPDPLDIIKGELPFRYAPGKYANHTWSALSFYQFIEVGTICYKAKGYGYIYFKDRRLPRAVYITKVMAKTDSATPKNMLVLCKMIYDMLHKIPTETMKKAVWVKLTVDLKKSTYVGKLEI
jgi:hypothetical protein